MIIIAVTLLTIFHPGIAFAGNWAAAGWSLRKPKSTTGFDAKEVSSEAEEAKDRTVVDAQHV